MKCHGRKAARRARPAARVSIRAGIGLAAALCLLAAPAGAQSLLDSPVTASSEDGQITVEVGAGFYHVEVPSFDYGRNAPGHGFGIDEDADNALVTGRVALGLGQNANLPAWLGKNGRLLATYTHFNDDASDSSSFGASGGFGAPSNPFVVSLDGTAEDQYGANTNPPTTTHVRQSFTLDNGELGFASDVGFEGGTTLTPSLSLVIGHTDQDYRDNYSGQSSLGFGGIQTSFVKVDVGRWSVGPQLGLDIAQDLGGGFSLAGGARIALLYERSSLDGDDCADQAGSDGVCDGAIYRTSVSETENDVTYRLGLMAGLNYADGPFSAGLQGYFGVEQARAQVETPANVGDKAAHLENTTLTTAGVLARFGYSF